MMYQSHCGYIIEEIIMMKKYAYIKKCEKIINQPKMTWSKLKPCLLDVD